jgi:hypothetical protein
MLQSMSQTFCTITEYQFIYYNNPEKLSFLKIHENWVYCLCN